LSDENRSPEALALQYLRLRRGWLRKRLAVELGLRDERLLSRYERGEKPLSREGLDHIADRLGYRRAAVDALMSLHGFLGPEEDRDVSWEDLTPGELQEIDDAALAAGWTLAEELRAQLRRDRAAWKAEAARKKAGELWTYLKAASREERRNLVAVDPSFRSPALVLRLCEESVRTAAHRADEALELARLGLLIAGKLPDGEARVSRFQGFAWAHVGNAFRTANDLDRADDAFLRAWDLWRAGSESRLLPEWRLLDLEASLRRAERRFSEALELLDRAQALCRRNKLATARILLNKEDVFDQMGDTEGALAALAEAAPFIRDSRDSQLFFAHSLKTANNLFLLGRYAQAAKRLPEVRELALQQGNDLDLIRVLWLEARVMAGQGRAEEAVSRLEQVRRDFTARELPYDAALSGLDLALLWLEGGRAAKVRELARGMAWIFASKKIEREALTALAFFCEAARQETATLELTRSAIAKIEDLRRSAPGPRSAGGRTGASPDEGGSSQQIV
jgi:transcriptional regulator with XRE-family HTH domain